MMLPVKNMDARIKNQGNNEAGPFAGYLRLTTRARTKSPGRVRSMKTAMPSTRAIPEPPKASFSTRASITEPSSGLLPRAFRSSSWNPRCNPCERKQVTSSVSRRFSRGTRVARRRAASTLAGETWRVCCSESISVARTASTDSWMRPAGW